MYNLLNKLLLILMNIGTVIVAIFEFSNQDFSRLITFVAIFPVLLVPFLLNKTKFKLNEFEICMYYLFIFLAEFLGCVVNLYNIILWYDLFVHFLSGIFTFVKAVHPAKTLSLIEVIPCGILISFRDEHDSNALEPIISTLFGIIIDVRVLQFWKTPGFINSTL